MKNLILFIFSCLMVVSCEEKSENLFTIDSKTIKTKYYNNQSLDFKIENKSNKSISKTQYLLDEKEITLPYNLINEPLGKKTLKTIISFDGNSHTIESTFDLFNSTDPKPITYTILNTYNHDIKAYTQGLEFYNDFLYESTGNGAGNSGMRGTSSIRKVNYKTGEVLQIKELSDDIFGEGLTILNGKIYQLTYKNNKTFVYNLENFQLEKTFNYFPELTEGWGLTNNGKELLATGGDEFIYNINPNDFKKSSKITVCTNNYVIPAVNELEYINGKIIANIYQKDALAIINPKNGAVEGVIDLSTLKQKVNQHIDLDVLNGVAYHPKNKTLFVTGKNWDKIFEIKLVGFEF
jgi:glutaminyl-peptide cyclotransferase